MGKLQYQDIASQPERHLALTSLTTDEFAQLVPDFDRAFLAHMEHWCLDGSPRSGRRYTTYKNCPLPTAEQRLFFILMFLKTNPLQELHGALFDMPQGKTNMWIHTLLPVLQISFRSLGDAPSRNLAQLAQRLSGMELGSVDPIPSSDLTDAAPLFVTMAANDAFHAPRTRMNRSAVTAARRAITQSRTSS